MRCSAPPWFSPPSEHCRRRVLTALAEGIKRGGTLIMARPDEPLTFDPFIPGDNGSIYAIEQVCDALIEADDTGLGLRPGTGRVLGSLGGRPDLYFKIRDAKFSNGDPVTVNDVVFTLKTLSDPVKVSRLRAEAGQEHQRGRRQACEDRTERTICAAALGALRLCGEHRPSRRRMRRARRNSAHRQCAPVPSWWKATSVARPSC